MGRKKGQGNGEGSIVTIRRKGKIIGYAPEITLGWKDGRRLRKRGEVKKTRGEAREALRVLLEQHSRGVDLAAKPQKVCDFVEGWLNNTFALHARPRSLITYQQVAKHYIYPYIGDIAINKLTKQHVQKMLSDLTSAEFSAKTVSLARCVLRQALQDAVDSDLIERNVASLTRAPRVERKERSALTVEQVNMLLEAISDDRLGAAIELAVFLGLRRGEVCGLRLTDIDFEQGSITIAGTLQYIPKKGMQWGPPKTKSGRRTLRLSERLIASLRRHLERREEERAAMGWKACEYLFTSPKDGGPLNPARLYGAFKALAASVGLEAFRFHDLRHTTASLLARQGYGPTEAAAILGHAHGAITLSVYTHLYPQDVQHAAADIDQLLSEAAPPKTEP